jgi:hypothetical protein
MHFLSGHICWVKHPLCRLEFAGLLAQALKLGKGSSLVRFVTENALDLSQAVGTTLTSSCGLAAIALCMSPRAASGFSSLRRTAAKPRLAWSKSG